jgi:hypothetical protein
MAGHEMRPPPFIAVHLPRGITGGERRLVCGLYHLKDKQGGHRDGIEHRHRRDTEPEQKIKAAVSRRFDRFRIYKRRPRLTRVGIVFENTLLSYCSDWSDQRTAHHSEKLCRTWS